MTAVVEAARVAARSGIDDADVVAASTAGAAAHAPAQVGDGEPARQSLQEFVQIDADHALAVDAHREQFEMGDEFCKGLHTG
jgi:hypothetical protein